MKGHGAIWNGRWRIRRDAGPSPTSPFRPRAEDVEKLPPGVRSTIGLMLGAIHGTSFAGGLRVNDERGRPSNVRIADGDGTDIVIEVTGAGAPDEDDDEGIPATRSVPHFEPFVDQLAELSDQAVWVVEPNGATLMVNQPMARLLGSSVEELSRRSLLDAVADVDRWWVIGLFDPARPAHREPVDVRFKRRDGMTVWTALSLDPLPDAAGETTALVVFVTDMTGRRVEQQSLRENERRFRRSFEDAPIGKALVDLDGRILESNRAFGHILGRDSTALLGRAYRDLPPDTTVEAEEALARQAITGQVDGYSLERRFLHVDGHTVAASLNVSVARDEDGEPLHLVVQVEDISARKAAESASREAIARFHAAFVHAPIGMAIVGLDGSVREANPALCRMLETEPARVTRANLSQWVHEDDLAPLADGMVELQRTRAGSLRLQLRLMSAGETTVWTQLSVAVVSGEEGRPAYAIAQVEDITERQMAEHDLVHQTLHDPLTGLGNRLLLKDQLHQALGIVADLPFAVLFLDLDHFKSVNDTHGHDAGDVLLIEVGERLRRMVRGADTVARLGGDEFAVVARGITDLDHARAFSAKVQLALRSPFRIGATEIAVSASIGIVLGSAEYATGDQLLRDADVAMYRAKDRGRDRFEVFDDDVRLEEIERLETERTLRNALEDGGLVLHYQPVIDLHTGRAIGAEALLRLADPHHGLLEPARFLAVAHQSRLILQLGAWVLREVCSQLVLWRAGGFGHFTAWVNVSGLELASDRFPALVQETIEDYAIDPSRLRLEFSETDLLEAAPATINSLRSLTALGVEVGIDDFGTGYSSLAHLRDLPVSFLKIDSSFTRRLDEPAGVALVEAMVSLGRSLDLDVIAEGVESLRQVETLAVLGCGTAQGRLFAAPAPVPEAILPALPKGDPPVL
ncbi:MAG: EAL domain-containing protein [Acidimicrobiales bacterium]